MRIYRGFIDKFSHFLAILCISLPPPPDLSSHIEVRNSLFVGLITDKIRTHPRDYVEVGREEAEWLGGGGSEMGKFVKNKKKTREILVKDEVKMDILWNKKKKPKSTLSVGWQLITIKQTKPRLAASEAPMGGGGRN